MAMYGQPSLRKTNAGWDREAFIAGARYRALNFEARSRELGAFVCEVGDKRSRVHLVIKSSSSNSSSSICYNDPRDYQEKIVLSVQSCGQF